MRVQTAKLGCDNKPATVFNNTNQFAFIAYLCRKYAQNYLQTAEFQCTRMANQAKRPVCDLNLKGDFQEQQTKTVLGESNRTGNLTDKQIADVFKQ